MKNLTFLLALFLFFGCSDDDTSNESPAADLTVYKNQTGDFNADTLQAQHIDNNGTLNFYGLFDGDNNPTTIKTLTYQKTNNDTIVNLIIDPLTNKLTSSYTSVNGVKSDIMMKFDYPNTETLSVSVHQYDWTTMTSDIIYGFNIDRPNSDEASKKNFIKSTSSNWEVAGVIAAVAEVGFFINGGLASTFTGPIVLALVDAAVVLAIANPVSAIGIAIATVAIFTSSDAFSGEITPSDLPYPEDTQIENPVPTEEDPTPTLTPFDCSGVPISFELIMDQDGTIVLTEVKGSEGPYTYAIGEDVRDYPIFPNDYGNGFYLACVKDVNNCISCRAQELIRPTACSDDTFEIVITITSNSATASANGGQPHYLYLWSNGSNGPKANNLSEGTYTVSITDQNGCTNTADVVIQDIDIIIGTWYANSVLFNGTEIFDPICYEALVFTTTNFTAQDLGDCDAPQATGGDYSISGNTLNLNFTTGDVTGNISQQILELTETSLVVGEGNEYVYSYTKQEIDIFGKWTITETSTCDSTSGNTGNDNYTGPITLNTDFTVIMENDSNGNYLANNFTFANNILTINLSYQDFFTPNCGGVNYQTITDSFTYIYNEANDTFTGTSHTEKNEIIGSGCIEYGSICNGTGTLERQT